ncbi:MAG: XrtN system VIT domain-containing protein [Bacteroidota bacterium]
MDNQEKTKSNGLYYAGLIGIVITFTLYLLERTKLANNTANFGESFFFFINHAISIIYFLAIVINNFHMNRWRFLRMDKRHFINFITIFSITAFTLNESIPIFSRYVNWVNIVLILTFFSLHLLIYINKFPKIFSFANYLLLGLASINTLYFSIFLLPYLPIGLFGAIFFGISLYLFAPILLFITIIYQFLKTESKNTDIYAYIAGLIISILIIASFLYKWQKTENKIHQAHAALITRPENKLPKWLLISQTLPDDAFTQKIISSNLQYDNIESFDNWSGFPSNSLNDNTEHDPLIIIAQIIFGKFSLSNDDCLKIIESQYDARHLTYRKLWSAKDLSTTSVLNNIRVFPDYRLAYIEKTISIRNNSRSQWSQQEALYTFKLPEGSVASSLSLWIDGKEEKSRLTTKQKADSAYTTIVGRERRDPALLHWQEGNTITVTVFPCTVKEERIFKIGFTIPLQKKDNQLILNKIAFEGPDFSKAKETSVVIFVDTNKQSFQLPNGFAYEEEGKYSYSGNYNEDMVITCNLPALSAKSFSFNNKSYSMKEMSRQKAKFNPGDIYLDVNKSWTEAEFNKVYATYKNKHIFVYYDKLIKLDGKNKNLWFRKLNKFNFSLFPFGEIKNVQNSLVISKSTGKSPNLGDIKKTEFAINLKKFLAGTNKKIRIFNIGNGLSPYLKTLKEFGVFEMYKGNIEGLNTISEQKEFFIYKKSENSVALEVSNCEIIMNETNSVSKAPDHLMRLFAYNKILEQTGKNYFDKKFSYPDTLINIANEAYVVSPVSSLIVLETLKDYERFDIDKNKKSLLNASTKSSGAVPEPHEWALIILTLGFVVFLAVKKRFL